MLRDELGSKQSRRSSSEMDKGQGFICFGRMEKEVYGREQVI